MNRTMSARAKALRQAPHVRVSAGTPGVGEPPPSAALSASAKIVLKKTKFKHLLFKLGKFKQNYSMSARQSLLC